MANGDTLFDLARGAVQAISTELNELPGIEVAPEAREQLEHYLTAQLVAGVQLFLTGSLSGTYETGRGIRRLLEG